MVRSLGIELKALFPIPDMIGGSLRQHHVPMTASAIDPQM
jgi:hypothetical protein